MACEQVPARPVEPVDGQALVVRSDRHLTGDRRVRLFDDAVGALPDGVPVDTVLLQLRGEPQAPHRFWELARLTNGTLFMPSKDWP